jgi:hypothetical protein
MTNISKKIMREKKATADVNWVFGFLILPITCSAQVIKLTVLVLYGGVTVAEVNLKRLEFSVLLQSPIHPSGARQWPATV